MIDPLFLAVTRVNTVADDDRRMTNATGFFFERDEELFLVTNRHVVLDELSGHRPAQLEIELHSDPNNLVETVNFLIPLYESSQPTWHEASDTGGLVDIVTIRLDQTAFPSGAVYEAFTPEHLADLNHPLEVGTPLLIIGFPLGFQDSLHHLPVARQAVISSAFGMRFEGNGYFLTDSRLHRGTSGSPVVTKIQNDDQNGQSLPWLLLGVHSSRIDVDSRDVSQDDYLGLNCAWYANVLMQLTDSPVAMGASSHCN